MDRADFQYRLPRNLIAQYPSRERDQSRLMVVHRDAGYIEHRTFCDLPEFLDEGDVLVDIIEQKWNFQKLRLRLLKQR